MYTKAAVFSAVVASAAAFQPPLRAGAAPKVLGALPWPETRVLRGHFGRCLYTLDIQAARVVQRPTAVWGRRAAGRWAAATRLAGCSSRSGTGCGATCLPGRRIPGTLVHESCDAGRLCLRGTAQVRAAGGDAQQCSNGTGGSMLPGCTAASRPGTATHSDRPSAEGMKNHRGKRDAMSRGLAPEGLGRAVRWCAECGAESTR